MRKKKRFIQVAGNPLYARPPRPSKSIDNPTTGTPVFGQFPELAHQPRPFVAGPIYLRYGEHFGPNAGYGLCHIWQEHFKSAASAEDALPAVAELIARVLQPGATIHYEFGTGTAGNRATVFKSPAGIAILEERYDGNNSVFYSIVTIFPGRNAHGPVIGAM